MKRKIHVLLMFFGLIGTLAILSACGGGGGGGAEPPTYTQEDFQGVWYLNLKESNVSSALFGTYFEFTGDNAHRVTIRDELIEEDIEGPFSIDRNVFTATLDGMTITGTVKFSSDKTKLTFYWSEASGGETKVFDKTPEIDEMRGIWNLNIQESNWVSDDVTHYGGSFIEICDLGTLFVTLVYDGESLGPIEGTYVVYGANILFEVEGLGVASFGTFERQGTTKLTIYWDDGDIEVYDKDLNASSYLFGFNSIGYRYYEDGTDRYQIFVGMTKDGNQITESDIDTIQLYDATGTEYFELFGGFDSQEYMTLDCTTLPCIQGGPTLENGFFKRYSLLPASTYTVKVSTSDGQHLLTAIPYPGQLTLPYVASSSMSSAWSGQDLVLSWVNPTGEANWSEVDQLRITLFDGAGNTVLMIRGTSELDTVTIAGNFLDQAEAIHGAITHWQVQTRAYDQNDMNFARAYSDPVVINAP
jgi:hypothetical protein